MDTVSWLYEGKNYGLSLKFHWRELRGITDPADAMGLSLALMREADLKNSLAYDTCGI